MDSAVPSCLSYSCTSSVESVEEKRDDPEANKEDYSDSDEERDLILSRWAGRITRAVVVVREHHVDHRLSPHHGRKLGASKLLFQVFITPFEARMPRSP